MEGQLSLSDCFITRNVLRGRYNLVGLYPPHGDEIIPPSEMEHEKEMCAYWVYYNASCKAKIAPKCFDEWKKEQKNNPKQNSRKEQYAEKRNVI